MTAFVLVSTAHTGGWIWHEVAARLRSSGAEVHPVTLTGMGDGGRPAGPDTDLETHIEDVVRLLDEVEQSAGSSKARTSDAGTSDAGTPQVVLVGHGYGIHPVLGAADRRPGRIARVVHLDAGLPQDGEPPLNLVPDQALRERLYAPEDQGRVAAAPHGAEDAPDDGQTDWQIAPPPADAWRRWGSTEGVPAEALARLARLAAPQPRRTLTQALRLTGAAAGVPTTGVLCVANGSSIETVEALVGLGEPRLQALADPRVTFFELGTGHWPMLSSPDELADVLLRAAAGEGHRISATVRDQPPHLRPFLLKVAEQPRERVGRVDMHLPAAEEPRPAVVFVHGGPVPADARPTPRDWPAYAGYAQYVASLGAVGVTVDHRLHGLDQYGLAEEDIAETVALVQADPRVDADRVALWFFSAGGLLSARWLAAPPPWLRCVAATYPILAPLPNWPLPEGRFRPASAVRGAGRLPIVLTRVGLERAEIAVTVEEFHTAAADCEAQLELVDVPSGHHGFETIDHTEEAREAVERAVRSVLGHLGMGRVTGHK